MTPHADADYSFDVIKPTMYVTAIAAGLVLAAPVRTSAQSEAGSSGRPAAYTAPQVTQGETVFRNTCGNCHSTSQFSGPAFEVVWAGRPVFEFFDQLRSTMPLDNPGGLSREDYVGVIAYILKLNRYPPGDPLPHDDAGLRKVKFARERPDS